MKRLQIPVLYEDANVVVFNKPSGLMIHADGRSDEYTLADYMRDTYPETVGVGEPLVLERGRPGETRVDRPGIVHRLDRDTSGAIIVARNQQTFLFLKRQFKEHEVRKVYQAIVAGNIKNDTGIIDAAIGRSRSDFRLKATLDLHTKDARGRLREAVTRYKVLERFNKEWQGKLTPLSLVEVYPLTGRTHQIRTHFKTIRHPLLADPLYSATKRLEGYPFEATRTMLHASKITFKTNATGEITVEAPLPADFQAILAKIR